MPKFYIEVWASVGSCHAKEIIEVQLLNAPTDEQMEEEYRDTIGNILDSGYTQVTKADFDAWQEGK